MKTKRLISEVVPVADINAALARELFAVFTQHYDCVSWEQFDDDLSAKDFIILLREADSGEVRGFSTQQILKATVGGVSLRAIFSGDTIIDRAFWGEQELVRAWCRFAGQIRAAEPETPLFWFLISKGYRTYLYLPIFFHRFFPRHDARTPNFEDAIIDGMASRKYPEHYHRASGLLEFSVSKGHLSDALSEIPEGRRHDPNVQFFLERNPRYFAGNELVCLAEISASNMRGLAMRIMLEGEALGPLQGSLAHV